MMDSINKTLGDWASELIGSEFDETKAEIDRMRIHNQKHWVVLCEAMRVDKEKVHGFPVSVAFMPNVHNKAALDAMEALARHVESRSFVKCFDESTTKAIQVKSKYSILFGLQKRLDVFTGSLAITFWHLTMGVSGGKLYSANDATLKGVAGRVAKLVHEERSLTSFVEGAKFKK